MRKVFLLDPHGNHQEQRALAASLGVSEVVVGIPGLLRGKVDTLPAVVLESRNQPGVVVRVLPFAEFGDAHTIPDLPPIPHVLSSKEEIEVLRGKVALMEQLLLEHLPKNGGRDALTQ